MQQTPSIIEQVAIYNRSAVGGPSATLKLERCQDYCLSKWGGHGVVFEDTGVSGLYYEGRALNLLVQNVRAGSTKILVVYDFEALGRSLFHAAYLVHDLIREGIEIHAVTLGGPVKSHQTVFFADEQRRLLLARLKAGRERGKRERESQRS